MVSVLKYLFLFLSLFISGLSISLAATDKVASNQGAGESLLKFDGSTDGGHVAENDLSVPSHAVLVARDQAKLSSQFSGEIAKVTVRQGDTFKKGQILIQFKCEEQIAGYQKAVAEEKSAKTAQEAAIKLDKLESISKLEVAKAKAAYSQARAQALYTTALLSKCQIRAPYAGTVVELPAKEHETVKPGDPLIEIVNNNSLIARVYAPSSWLKWIKPKTQFHIKLKEYPQMISAHVVKVGAAVDTSSQTIQLYGQLDKQYKGLVNGMSGLAYFKDQPHE